VTGNQRSTAPRPAGPALSILRGVWLLGHGDAEGLNCFGTGADAVLAALAPSVALFLVVTVLQLLQGPSALPLTKIVLLLCAVLTRLVLSHALAVRWSREGLWTRYAAASLWCDWLPGVLSFFASGLLHMVAPAIADTPGATLGLLAVIEAYDLWLSWFVARAGLVLKSWQAALLVAAIFGATIAIYVVAAWLPPHYDLWMDLTAPVSGK
jgi:hypothetical protein